ncbi:thiamine pyrophosphate-binding protein [Balneatrix alpica]|uniref:Thiamine pyrophosphate-binding protein n=1 Tax=Balneatrix alpica TaxID=75684 RepID=A0ABV5ZAJ3_9GAMM|nr:thiamine pyrophosphate-binding protein [Balneatrix alpica]
MSAAVSPKPRQGGRILVDQLAIQGCRRVFVVPGESYLPVLDALYQHEQIDTIVCRQEGGAAMMAEAHAKLTGSVGVCMVTRGPGATNASAGVHVAMQDSTPMLLLIGQVETGIRDREAFQEVDYRQMFAPLAKWVAEVDSIERLPEYLSRAYYQALSGRPGPVVLALPEDVLFGMAACEDCLPAEPALALPDTASSQHLLAKLAVAERPAIIVGGPRWSEAAGQALLAFAEHNQIGVCTSMRCKDYVDNSHPCYMGDLGINASPALQQWLSEADVILVLGARLGEMTSQSYQLFSIPNPTQQLIHVMPDSAELGRVYRPALALQACPEVLSRQLGEQLLPLSASQKRSWQWRVKQQREAYEGFIQVQPLPGKLRWSEAILTLQEQLQEDAILCNGAGNYAAFLHRFYQHRRYRTQLAPTSGSMGYGLPAAVAAALAAPRRQVVCVAGDGCLLMHGQELATAVQYGVKMLVIVVNNGHFGTIRMHQEKHYPGRVMATQLHNPDFVAWGRSFGAWAALVQQQDEFAGALAEALAQPGPALLELQVEIEALTPARTLSQIRAESLARQGQS